MHYDSSPHHRRTYFPPLAMSYSNQSFAPQSGQGNLSAQFNTTKLAPTASSSSSPRDIPARRQSGAYNSYPPTGPPPGANPYGHSPSYARDPRYGTVQDPRYGTSPNQIPPMQMPVYATSPNQPPVYATSPNQMPVYAVSPQAQPAYAADPSWRPVTYDTSPPANFHPIPNNRTRSGSESSHRSRRSSHSSDEHNHDHHPRHSHDERRSSHDHGHKHHHKRKDSRIKSTRRPTLTDSVLLAMGSLRGAFDTRK